MDFRDSPEEAAFRERLRTWLTERAGTFPTSGDEYWSRQGEWHRALYDGRLLRLVLAPGVRGQELPPVYDVILDEELARAGAPPRPSLGYLVHGLGRHGREELRRRFLPGMIDGTERWCQGFSEPGAGSDLASLTTTARAGPAVAAAERGPSVGVDPAETGLAPVQAIPKALARAGLSAAEVDLFEINEAFAAMCVATIRLLGLDPDRVNVNGSGCSLGHPVAATGARMLVTLVHELRRRGGGIGVAAMCAGGGMGSAAVIEVPAP